MTRRSPRTSPSRSASTTSKDALVHRPRVSRVRVGASPQWLRARLHLAGMRSISNVVDVTNYVMHVWGSPLHAFDRSLLAGGRIVVRRARQGETLRTIDGALRQLEPGDLLITDGEKPVALAAIMGGLESEVSDATTEVLLEAANFEPIGVLRTSERLALRTEGSNKWEKESTPTRRSRRRCSRADSSSTSRPPSSRVPSTCMPGCPSAPSWRCGRAGGERLIGLDVPEDDQRDPRASRLPGGRRVARDGADPPSPRRHTGDRPRRGGRARRPRSGAAYDAAPPRGRGAPDARAAVPPCARGRARRRRLLPRRTRGASWRPTRVPTCSVSETR